MNIKKLKLARNKVDSIDKKIFNLIKKRTKIVNYMMIIKKKKNQIIDRKRINIILKNIRKKSLINRIDPNITLKIWKAMIWSYIDYQKKNFKKK
tara:strand:- start:6 stop:287 length:282 start_codon:yes stop_codon:yes gene_type:complete